MLFKPENRKRSYNDYTLILPCVSVGNVGQLTADLLISTLWMSRVGYLHHEAILPVVGNDPFAHPDATTCKLTTACEVYESSINKLLVVQQRSPLIKCKRAAFLKDLMTWIDEENFKQLVILTSSHAHERLDKQLIGSQLRYLATPSMDRRVVDFLRETLQWTELELRPLLPASPQPPPGGATDGIYIPGGGVAARMYRLCEDQQVPSVTLMLFCAEGDNSGDALSLATHANDWLSIVDFKEQSAISADTTRAKSRKIPSLSSASAGNTTKPTSWKIPSSWRLTFGNTFDRSLYS